MKQFPSDSPDEEHPAIPEFSVDLIQCLRGFYHTARTGSMTAASVSMQRNQSTLSHQIKSLEQELGVSLFYGSKNRRMLTEEGKYLLKQVGELARLLNDMQLRTDDKNREIEGELSLATAASSPLSPFTERLLPFCAAYPGIHFRHQCESEEETLLRQIEAGNVDFGLVDEDNVTREFEFIPLFTSPFVLLTPLEGPYALQTLPSPERLCELPFLAPPLRSRLWQTVVRQFRRHDCHVAYTHIIGDRDTLLACVANGLGVTILDEASCLGPHLERLNRLPLSAYLPPRQYRLVWRSNLYLHPHHKAFLAWFMDQQL